MLDCCEFALTGKYIELLLAPDGYSPPVWNGDIMNKEFIEWEAVEGAKILTVTGIKAGDTVVDFGCGNGHYTFAAAHIVGNNGKVIAVDQSHIAIKQISDRCKQENIKNIAPMLTDGGIHLDIPDESVDAVLLYDILHHFQGEARTALLEEVRRILKPEAILSLHPTHETEHGKTIDELVVELVMFGFEHTGSVHARLIHYRFFQESTIHNFSMIK